MGGKSIYAYLLGALVEWVLILMLLLNSVFSYLIFRFAHYFRLKKPCFLCCSSALLFSLPDDDAVTDLVCHRHAALIAATRPRPQKLLQPRPRPVVLHNCKSCRDRDDDSRFKQSLIIISQQGYDDSFVDEKAILEATAPDPNHPRIQHHQLEQQRLISYNYYDDDDDSASFRDLGGGRLISTADDKSTQFIRDVYSNENVVEFTFAEDDEYVQKDIVHDDGIRYRVLQGGEGLSEAEQLLLTDDTSCCLGQDESAGAAATGERSKFETQFGTLIKHKKVNDDEFYSIAYTAEGDLIMDLCRNLASTKSISTASDAFLRTTEQQGDELSHQARGERLASQNIENAERMRELDEENDQPREISNDISIQSCPLYGTNEHVHDQIDEVARSLYPSPPSSTKERVFEQVEETLIPASIDLPSEHTNEPNGGGVPHALPNSPLAPNLEELSDIQVERYQEQTSAMLLSLSAEDHSEVSLIDNEGSDQVAESMALSESNSVEATQHPVTISLDLTKNEEDKLPDTPCSFDGVHNLYRNWLLLGKETTTDETLDGSVISDFECGEGILTVDKLKTALKVERKALHALYAELEEERNASAVAACQTMAMINRLQEEKASVQMEALQYQRMMEEQSEYDQEALQLLNDLMIKREKEKKELEKELEIYRKRIIDYETKERLMMLNRKEEGLKSGSSVSCSNADDSDGVSVDLKVKNMNGCVGKEENGNENTPLDDVLHMEESLSHFEEERFSILEQLKVLEENLLTLDDGDDGFSCNHDFSCSMNGTENGYRSDVKGNYHQERRIIGPKGKMLLPLFDATVDGNENGELSRNENGHDFTSYPHSSSSNSEPENKNIYIEEEVDNVYERLQTLEADYEFLRHCFSSLKRGDKGLELLQEILQHLRSLRSVELEVRK